MNFFKRLFVNKRDRLGHTKLQYAAMFDDRSLSVDRAKALIADGANVNAKDKYGFTALWTAVTYQNYDILTFLLAAGAVDNCKDRDGNTLLMFAIEWTTIEFVEALISAGFNVNAIDKKGNTTLMHAVDCNKPEYIKALLKAGADPNAKNKTGQTAIEYAELSHNFAELSDKNDCITVLKGGKLKKVQTTAVRPSTSHNSGTYKPSIEKEKRSLESQKVLNTTKHPQEPTITMCSETTKLPVSDPASHNTGTYMPSIEKKRSLESLKPLYTSKLPHEAAIAMLAEANKLPVSDPADIPLKLMSDLWGTSAVYAGFEKEALNVILNNLNRYRDTRTGYDSCDLSLNSKGDVIQLHMTFVDSTANSLGRYFIGVNIQKIAGQQFALYGMSHFDGKSLPVIRTYP